MLKYANQMNEFPFIIIKRAWYAAMQQLSKPICSNRCLMYSFCGFFGWCNEHMVPTAFSIPQRVKLFQHA